MGIPKRIAWYFLMLDKFFGNSAVAAALSEMAGSGRIPQTLLLSGPEGVGKATLARRFATLLRWVTPPKSRPTT